MKLIIFSDVHGNGPAFEALLRAPEVQAAQGFVFCGDLCGYYYDAATLVARFAALPGLRAVLGNHDAYYLAAQSGEMDRAELCRCYGSSYAVQEKQVCRYLSTLPKQIFWQQDGISFGLVHGTPQNLLEGRLYPDTKPKDEAQFSRCDVWFCGHTHYAMQREIGGARVINPGSLGQPRDGGFRYGIFDTVTGSYAAHTLQFDWKRLEQQIVCRDPDMAYLRDVLCRTRQEGKT